MSSGWVIPPISQMVLACNMWLLASGAKAQGMQKPLPPRPGGDKRETKGTPKMKKILAALAVAALASTASALAPAHDLTTQGGTNGSCQYCHAPHLWNPVAAVFAGVAPLWNRAAPGLTTPYTSTTLNGSIVVGPNSLTCLTCHDGITNLGAVSNGAVVGDLAAPLATAVVGLDLTDDHPVGVPLVAVAGAYQLPTLTQLYTSALADRVECASCHEPHAVSPAGAFLRADRADLCGDCHLK